MKALVLLALSTAAIPAFSETFADLPEKSFYEISDPTMSGTTSAVVENTIAIGTTSASAEEGKAYNADQKPLLLHSADGIISITPKQKGRFPVPGGKMSQVNAQRPNGTALQIAAPAGTPILAMWDGQVVASGFDGKIGHWVKIKHDNGLVTSFQFMGKASRVAIGERVTRGQRMSSMGRTGLIARQAHRLSILKVEIVDSKHGMTNAKSDLAR